MASPSSTGAREARRRKITERGSDRLALITGRIQTLQSPSSSSSSSSSSSPFSDFQFPSSPQLDEPRVSPKVDEGASRSTLRPKVDPVIDPTPAETGFSRTTSEPSGTASETNRTEPTRSLGTESRHAESRARAQNQILVFTPKQISSAISSTEEARLFCSAAFSVVVVLSCLGFPILGSWVFKSVLCFRPLYLVLITNVTIVVSQILEKERGSGRTGGVERRDRPPAEGNDIANQIGKTLEIGLLVRKIVDAVLMDCAVYLVIVVCGLSFARK